ncbi:MAG: hypothetical protein ABIQ86_14210 [Steroidobacteraceae bacterium]
MSEPRAPYRTGGDDDQPLIRNCRFAFRCHQRWQSLEQTGNPGARYCHECSRQVLLCRNNAELRAALQADECVAIESDGPSGLTHTVGVIDIRAWQAD